MIKVTLDIAPHGDESKTYKVGELKIINDLTGNLEYGNYEYFLDMDGEILKGKYKRHSRRSGILPLVRTILTKCINYMNSNK